MTLHVTPELVQELADYDGDAFQAGLKLGTHGWEFKRCLVGPSDGLVALWASWVQEYAEGEPLDPAQAAELAVADQHGRSYAVRDEDGDSTEPADGVDYVVVTGQTDAAGDEIYAWDDAWWFDKATADLVLGEAHGAYREHGQAEELWVTATGRWVCHVQSAFAGGSDYWVATGHDAASDAVAAARLVYGADHDRLAADAADRHPLVAAALAARTLVDALAPETPVLAGHGDYARRQRAADTVHATRAASELLRAVVLRDLRDHRGDAAATVVSTFERGSQSEAARYLGIGLSTLNGLLGGSS